MVTMKGRGLVCVLVLLSLVGTCMSQGCIFSARGKEYSGNKDTTVSGRKCVRWDSRPLPENITDADFPDVDLQEAGSFCRNPNNAEDGPWCYTGQGQTSETCGLNRCECLTTLDGKTYTGKINRTVTGKSCQHWLLNTPHNHTRHGDHKFPDRTEAEAANYCRNPDKLGGGPWCYTTDPSTRWEACPIPECVCRVDEVGAGYIGDISQTKSGISCQNWDSQVPHAHDLYGPSNLCRNPDKDPNGPWCFTKDPNVEKESCEIPRCFFRKNNASTYDHNPKYCVLGRAFNSYSGTESKTISGKTCQRWDSQTPHGHSFTDPSRFPEDSIQEAANYCRNPDQTSTGPWCYTTDPNTPRESCPVKSCECKRTRAGTDYAGKISRTQAGYPCQRWDTQSPHRHTMTDVRDFPDSTLAEAENFCRNPDRKEKGPWCYTSMTIEEWDYCTIPTCPEEKFPNIAANIDAQTDEKSGNGDGTSNSAALIGTLVPLAILACVAVVIFVLIKKKKIKIKLPIFKQTT